MTENTRQTKHEHDDVIVGAGVDGLAIAEQVRLTSHQVLRDNTP